MSRPIVSEMLDHIRRWEGLRLAAYRDPGGVLTIGYGHTGDVEAGQRITLDQAEHFLNEDLRTAQDAVERLVKVPLTDRQYSALVSFVFNVGEGQFAESTLLRKLNAGDYSGAADEFLRWTRSGSVELPGLVERRRLEREIFLDSEWRLFAPPETYESSFALETEHERELLAWLATRLGLRHRVNPEKRKVFVGLPILPPLGEIPITLKIRPLRQLNEVSCGQACVAMCVNAITDQNLTDADIDRMYGFALLQALNSECRERGFEWLDGGNLTTANYRRLAGVLQQKLPVILGLNGPEFSPSGRGHIITLTALKNDQITFADPASGTFRTTTRPRILVAPPHPDGKFFFYPRRLAL